MKDIIICAVESSCDETAVALVKNGNEILSNIVSSQIETHVQFGGVIPEVASRLHIENISVVISEALQQSGMDLSAVDAIAVTQGPGLIGCLHVGVQAAKTLAWVMDKPLIPVHHIAGHIYANRFVDELHFPLLALVVSGGHTELVYMAHDYSFEVIGQTSDDAIGEAFDKVARVLGLGYPGGPKIDKLAREGTHRYLLPKIKTLNPMEFSFSGLKSSVIQTVAREQREQRDLVAADLAYDFQETALDQLLTHARLALQTHPVKTFVLAGGVAANSRLRERVMAMMEDFPGIKGIIPPLKYCTDNAAMIGAAGYQAYLKGIFADDRLSADANLSL